MPRLARLDAPGVLHHVMGRGIEGRKIFLDDSDRQSFIDRVALLAAKDAMDVYAWSLMPNHFHLLVKTRNQPLASTMRSLLTGYVVNFNIRHRRHGHLFQNRYKSIVCQEDAYLKELVRYIHLNLLRASLVENLIELDRSPWSGHSTIIGRVKRQWQHTEYVLSYFGNSKKQYHRYVERGISQGRRPELVGGGLIRSLGGWSEVHSLRKRGEEPAYDQRILGNSEFVEGVRSSLDDVIKKNLRLSGRRADMDALAQMVCNKYGVSIVELCSGSRRAQVVKARQAISWIGVRELGYSGAEVARFLGVTNSCVTRTVVSSAKPEVDDLIDML